jgi:hypothetical protein
MYVTAPHAEPPVRGSGTADALRLAHVDHHVAAGGRPFTAMDRDYFRDLWRVYGIRYEEDLFAVGRNSFHDLLTVTMSRLGAWGAEFDLAVLASATTDTEPVFPMAYLADATGGGAFTFAVSDQGTAGPFTALRMAADGILSGEIRRALVLTVDQSARLHTGPVPEPLRPRADAVAALVLEPAGALGSVVVEQATDVPPGEVASRFAAAFAGATAGDQEVDVVTGAGFAAHWDGCGARALPAARGMPGTGVWATFAEALPRWRSTGRRVLLADYDESLRYLSLCRVDIPPAARP